jgi:Putative zinc-binding metallo-peptidase
MNDPLAGFNCGCSPDPGTAAGRSHRSQSVPAMAAVRLGSMATRSKSKGKSGRSQARDYRWAAYDDEQLLALRFCDLRLRIHDSDAWPSVASLYATLQRRGLRFRPHVWLGEEWFSPDGVPGISVPFYLAHPRLQKLERRYMGEVEGGSRKWLMRILRHEAGHAIDTAYGLRRRADWRRVFGPSSQPYPGDYAPRPSSRNHVLHLGHWYAQSHPTEDFAETFAVWLQPKARWRRDYADWPALEKLEYVDRLMAEIAGRPPVNRDRTAVEPLATNERTLAKHYRRKAGAYLRYDRRYDRWLRRAFVDRGSRPRPVSAATFIREIEPQLRRLLVRRSRLHPYLVDHAIETTVRRVRELDLVLRRPRRESKRRVVRLHERVVLDVLKRNRENYAL